MSSSKSRTRRDRCIKIITIRLEKSHLTVTSATGADIKRFRCSSFQLLDLNCWFFFFGKKPENSVTNLTRKVMYYIVSHSITKLQCTTSAASMATIITFSGGNFSVIFIPTINYNM